MKKYLKSILCVLLAVCMIIPMLAACTGNDTPTNDTENANGTEAPGEAGTNGGEDATNDNNNPSNNNGTNTNPPLAGISNETTPLVIASEALDGVFNPFYYTNGADGDVVGLTQLGMLTTDEKGNLVCGYDVDSVALAYSIVTTGTQADYDASNSYKDYYTDYYFAIKNGIKFSNGETLTINDVLFNIYVLVDPAYTGSSTLYSVDIQGLKAYRSQSRDEAEQDQMDEYFDSLAADRITEVTLWCEDEGSTKDQITPTMQEVISKAEELFREELQSDWSSASSSIESYEKYGFTEAWQVFLYMEGLVTVKSEKDQSTGVITYEVDYNGYDKVDHSRENMVNTVYTANLGASALSTYKTNLRAIVAGGWVTAGTLREYFKTVVISDYFAQQEGLQIPNVSGITTYKATSIPTKEGETALGEECDILKVRINGVDPKAIYNLSFTVAPMSYYSTAEEIAQFSVENNHFGVNFSNRAFFDQLQVKQVPVGAGPYKASNAEASCSAESAIPEKNQFYADNIVYYERNNNFYTVFGKDSTTANNAKIKKVRYKVIATDQMFNAVTGASQEVYYSAPQASTTNMNKLTGNNSVGYALADNMGYGYIGINAKYVEDINIRRAIMYCMDTGLCLDYYGGNLASILYRSMSSNSWAYPDGCLPYYAEYSYADCEYDNDGNLVSVGKFDDELAKASAQAAAADAGYTLDARTGLLKNPEGETLTFTFTIAGDSTDHPAYQTMQKAADLLNSIGFDVTVTKDANALSKLASGGLQVWAAAWSSTIDPDMFQVYHIDSTATSIKNWGFPTIMEDSDRYEEQELLEELAYLIEDARATVDQDTRTELYAEALDLVMEIAVELATYQRKNLFIWNADVIDSTTLCEANAYQSPLSKIWTVSLRESN